MKRLWIILATAAIILGFVWFVPHSLFRVTVENPARADSATTASPSVTDGDATAPVAVHTSIASLATSAAILDASTPAGIHVAYQNVSFDIPVSLSSNAIAETAPGSPGPLDPAPVFLKFSFDGYPFDKSDGYFPPQIRVYPVKEYAAVSSWAAESLKRLTKVLDDPSSPRTNDTLPNVPYMGAAAQLYAAQVKQIPFKSGKGIRMISSYEQYPAAIGPYSSFYHYEGLTQDGQYWVVVEMPVFLPVWADTSNPGEFGITYERKDWSEMGPYYQAVTDLLNQHDEAGFTPMLSQLDTLVQSITVQSSEKPAK